jgi:hypothetical protein
VITNASAIDDKRSERLAKIPARHAGRAHWAFIHLTTVLGIDLCLVARDSPVWDWILGTVLPPSPAKGAGS